MKKIAFCFLLLLTINRSGAQCLNDVIASFKSQKYCTPISQSSEAAATRLSSINFEHNTQAQLFTIKKTKGSSPVYEVFSGQESAVYSGKSYNDAMSSILSEYDTPRKNVYLDLVNFTAKEESNIKSSCSVRLHRANKEVQINTLNRSYFPVEMQDDFFKKLSTVTDIQTSEIVTHTGSSQKTYYSGKVSYMQSSKRMVIEVFSDVKNVVRDYISKFREKLLGLNVKPRSTSDMVGSIRRAMMKKYGTSYDNVIVNYRSQLSNNMLVGILTKRYYRYG